MYKMQYFEGVMVVYGQNYVVQHFSAIQQVRLALSCISCNNLAHDQLSPLVLLHDLQHWRSIKGQRCPLVPKNALNQLMRRD